MPIELSAGFATTVVDIPDWSHRVHAVTEVFGRLAVAGAFAEGCPQLQWSVSVTGTVATVRFSRLPADAAALGAAARVLLALAPDLPLVSLRATGRIASRPHRALPALAIAAMTHAGSRPQLAFAAEVDPGTEWLHVEVNPGVAMDLPTAGALDEAMEVWMNAANAGALSEPTSDFEIQAGDAAVFLASVGADFWSTQAIFHDLAPQAPSVLLNMFDEIARTKAALGHVSLT